MLFRSVAENSHANAIALRDALCAIPGAKRLFSGAMFHEFVVQLNNPVGSVLQALKAEGILGGLALAADYPELGNALLVCATETKEADDLRRYVECMQRIL